MVMVSEEPSSVVVLSVIEHISEVHVTAQVSTVECVGDSTERVMELVAVDDIVRTGTPGTVK